VDDRRVFWIALNLVLAEHPNIFRKVIQRFCPVAEAFKADPGELMRLGVDEEDARRIASSETLDRARKEVEFVEKKKYAVLILEDEEYPDYLKEIFDPPLVLYCAGRADVLSEPAVAIVGARDHTPYGRAVAEKLAFDLASRGLVVVSGMARGIDSIAHWGALRGGKTVAVLGSGFGQIYPKENRLLFERIAEKGAVVSEYPLGSPPLAHHFPLRNRIISGLALGTVVVEASLKSGSLISAGFALEQNREVMAVPGNITSELSRGSNRLIQNGAKLVRDWEDVVESLPSPFRETLLSQNERGPELKPALTPEEAKIFACLKIDSLTPIDELVDRTGFSVSELLARLLDWELRGWISQHPGKCFQRRI
jgi:DNA processing protein